MAICPKGEKEVKNTEENTTFEGWSHDMRNIADSFQIHRMLLHTLIRMNLLNTREAGIMQRDFEQNYWNKLRDGE